jgi:uncharacterized glyoxalase superfamily protein PhnB
VSDFKPNGWRSLTPRVFAPDAPALIDFLRRAFGATGEAPDGRPAELTIGDSILMVSGIEARPATRSCFYLYVEDADATYARAIAAGATPVEEPCDVPYGDRRAMVEDPAGNAWQIATRKPRR